MRRERQIQKGVRRERLKDETPAPANEITRRPLVAFEVWTLIFL